MLGRLGERFYGIHRHVLVPFRGRLGRECFFVKCPCGWVSFWTFDDRVRANDAGADHKDEMRERDARLRDKKKRMAPVK